MGLAVLLAFERRLSSDNIWSLTKHKIIVEMVSSTELPVLLLHITTGLSHSVNLHFSTVRTHFSKASCFYDRKWQLNFILFHEDFSDSSWYYTRAVQAAGYMVCSSAALFLNWSMSRYLMLANVGKKQYNTGRMAEVEHHLNARATCQIPDCASYNISGQKILLTK